jgi:hypothetical protein
MFGTYQLWRTLGVRLALGTSEDRRIPGGFQAELPAMLIRKEIGHWMDEDLGDGNRQMSFGAINERVLALEWQFLTSEARLSLVWDITQDPKAERRAGFSFREYSKGEEGDVCMVAEEVKKRPYWEKAPNPEGLLVDLFITPGLVANGNDDFQFGVDDWKTLIWKKPLIAVVGTETENGKSAKEANKGA